MVHIGCCHFKFVFLNSVPFLLFFVFLFRSNFFFLIFFHLIFHSLCSFYFHQYSSSFLFLFFLHSFFLFFLFSQSCTGHYQNIKTIWNFAPPSLPRTLPLPLPLHASRGNIGVVVVLAGEAVS